MRLHRFYVPPQHNKYGVVPLAHEVWIHNAELLNQWQKVLRYREGQQVVLFDGVEHERLYELTYIGSDGAHFKLLTDFTRKLPERELYLFWSLLKKDNNDIVLQKCTELGVSHFVPLLAERSEKTGFNIERSRKIVIEAAEQSGRGNVPGIREPLSILTALEEYNNKALLLTAQQRHNAQDPTVQGTPLYSGAVGVFVGPEGGWSDVEKSLFQEHKIVNIDLSQFTLRAETASIVAVDRLLK